jgi:uncharacterized protein (TIGR03083 family)
MTTSPLARDEAYAVLAAEVAAFRALVDQLADAEYDRPVTSAGWRVRDVVAHTTGQLEEQARLPVFLRRLGLARRRYPRMIVLDGHNQVQLDDVAGCTPADLRERLHRFAPAGLKGVRTMPGLVRRLPSRWFFGEPALAEPGLDYIMDVIAARDTWMHRLEIARATGRPFVTDAHDAVVVTEVLRELRRDWTGPALRLELTGAATLTWGLGTGTPDEVVQVDATELMLHLSGRDGLKLPEGSPLAPYRVVF